MQYTEKNDWQALCRLYGEALSAKENTPVFHPLTVEELTARFAGEENKNFYAYEKGEAVGFVSGRVDRVRNCGYISCLAVKPTHRRQGIASRLMAMLEESLSQVENLTKLEVVFHNPVHLPWQIPNGGEDGHPCVPGVAVDSPLYRFLEGRGFRTWAVQNAYYQRLSGYTDPPQAAQIRAKLALDGILLTRYDANLHRGLPELFDNIRNPGWKAEVLAHTNLPIVVAVDTKADNLVVSYTGPLSTDPDGRGNFCGIGTRTDYRGHGIGKAVFCEMCRQHEKNGAAFMSLYTGENNPARKIYESAGFGIVCRFADMRKEFLSPTPDEPAAL